MPIWAVILRMQFWGFRMAMWQECPCTDPGCQNHHPPQYFK